MGIKSYSVQYMNNGAAQASGNTRALGNTGNNHYWTRIKVTADANGCSSVSLTLDANCYHGAYGNTPYGAGAQLTVSTSATPSSYDSDTANITGTYLGNNQNYWRFSGTVSVNLKANTTYYLFLLPCWTTTDYFALSVTGKPNISAADWPSYSLTVTASVGALTTVQRTASDEGAPTGAIYSGSTIYAGDKLTFSYYEASEGYYISTHTVNGVEQFSGTEITVDGDVTIVVTAAVKNWPISISPGTGAALSVVLVERRFFEVSTGLHEELSDGDLVFYGDVLEISGSAESGYIFGSCYVNGEPVSGQYVVSGMTTVTATATQAGAWLYDSSQFASYQIMIFNGTAWETYIPYVYTGSQWEVF